MPGQYYSNPFGEQQWNDPGNANPFMSGYIRNQSMEQAAPFVEMSRQRQQLELEQARQQQKEFMSPQGLASRQTGLEKTTAENIGATREAPYKSDQAIEEAKQKIRALPGITDKNIAEAENATMAAKGKPQGDLLRDLGTAYPAVRDASPETQPLLYEGIFARWSKTHLGAPIPPDLQTWKPERLQDMALAHYAGIHDYQTEQKNLEEQVKGAEQQKQERIRVAGGLAQTQTTQAGELARSTYLSEQGNPDKHYTNLLQRATQGKLKAGEEDEIPLAIENKMGRDMELKGLTGMTLSLAHLQEATDGGQAIRNVKRAINQRKRELYRGFEKYMPDDLKAEASGTIKYDNQGNPVK